MTPQDLKRLPPDHGAVSTTGYRIWWLGWADNYALHLAGGPTVLVDDDGARAMLGAGDWTIGTLRRRIGR